MKEKKIFSRPFKIILPPLKTIFPTFFIFLCFTAFVYADPTVHPRNLVITSPRIERLNLGTTANAINIDIVPPVGRITINNGEDYTDSRDVVLTLDAVDSGGIMGRVTQMQFSNDGSHWSTAEPYVHSKNWTLSEGEGEKIVYVKFKDRAGNWSESFSDAIILDTTPPNQPPQIMSLFPQNNSKFREGDIVSIGIQVHDPDNDNLEYRYLVDGNVVQDWISSASYPWQTQIGDVKLKTITIEVRDGHGATASVETHIFLFRKPPKPQSEE
ncbi:MAG: hypothetical protein PHS93_03685 [Candidatus Omnitrophica bacterium]|nr:hypothetical protein [Candidatus Omnitrophota bacterium]MDD5352253.1 hypothetical protein [Candidatus Omnitrophota bacterium]MDD5549851.1 hypothetical protein [Candidatus Omnitrophota bacterium]